MLRNKNIICISSIDWDFLWQGHQEIMSTFAKNGNRVLFIDNTGVRTPTLKDMPRIKKRIANWRKGFKGIRCERENLYVYSPIVLPFPYSRLARWINRSLILSILKRWIEVVDFNNAIIWAFLPTGTTLDLIDFLDKEIVIYYCIDSFIDSSISAKKIKITEKQLIRKADLIFVTSNRLYEYCMQFRSSNKDSIYKFPFGVDMDVFEKTRCSALDTPEELKGIKRPIVGYVGGVHKWVDQDLIKRIAKSNPNYSFVFVGPIQTDISKLSNISNIYFEGQKMHADVAQYVKSFDIGIIPYLITDYTRSVYPTKLNEYLIMGKPVVSTNLPEIEEFNIKNGNIVWIGKDAEEFEQCLNKALEAASDSMLPLKRIEAAKGNAWNRKINLMADIINQTIEIRKHQKEEGWAFLLKNLYKSTRKKILQSAFTATIVWLLIFHTNFLWVLANPLKILDKPQRSDAIVVFGGGVGESGSPDESTFERAGYAVELYNGGFANNIIFSSGYSYSVYNDAENMRLFAVSKGVPNDAIFIEKGAGSAYENVKFTTNILREKRWNSVLLVSSPYNMRRVSLVFRKLGRDINVKYLPVERPLFYNTSNGIKLNQVRAIFHEYLGIVYYWLKGYI